MIRGKLTFMMEQAITKGTITKSNQSRISSNLDNTNDNIAVSNEKSNAGEENVSVSSSKSKYVKDFDLLFVPLRAKYLQQKARDGSLNNCKFRSLCWRYFLKCLPSDFNKWLSHCEQSRKKYDIIKANHYEKLQTEEKESNSIYNTIQRDVIRTFPDMEFFRLADMQNIMGNVLYNFASENPQLSYKQGMHELVAILLYVLHTDSHYCLINYEGGYATQTIGTLLDLKYLEHDVFHIFCALMNYLEPWYQNDDNLTIQDDGSGFTKRPSSVLSVKLKKISESTVKRYDSELFYHLEALQIAPQIYGIRWMRLLFGREFEFLDLLALWDVLICDSEPMSLTDFVFASMLITIREELVNGDYTTCLNNLMRHQFEDVQFVIKLALHIREPKKKTNVPTESYEDLHSIVDYCWRLLSEQIDSLQRCLPREKSLRSEDEIFVALAQLKKVRDVLKGSLRI